MFLVFFFLKQDYSRSNEKQFCAETPPGPAAQHTQRLNHKISFASISKENDLQTQKKNQDDDDTATHNK